MAIQFDPSVKKRSHTRRELEPTSTPHADTKAPAGSQDAVHELRELPDHHSHAPDASVVGAGKHKDAPKRVASGTSQHVALDARLAHLDGARAKKLAAGVAMAGAVVLPWEAVQGAIACAEAAGGVPNIPGGVKSAELDVAGFLRALSTAGKIRVVADTGAAGPPASLACLAPDGALLVRADALAGAGGRKVLTLALVRAALEQRVRGERSDPETLRRASVYADAFARVIAPALEVPLGSPHVALPDLTGHAYYPAAGDDAAALVAVRHAFPRVTHALATDLQAIECTGECRGLPGLVIERKSGDAYDPTAALKDGASPSVVMLSCPGDWGSLLADPRFVARMIGVTAPGGVLANHARYMYKPLVTVLPPSTLGLALADVQVPPGTRAFVELFQKIGVVAEDELMARIELDGALAALAARHAGQGWPAREDTLPLVRRALEEPIEDITRELVARAAALGAEAEAAAKAALSPGADAVVLSLPEIGDTRALPVAGLPKPLALFTAANAATGLPVAYGTPFDDGVLAQVAARIATLTAQPIVDGGGALDVAGLLSLHRMPVGLDSETLREVRRGPARITAEAKAGLRAWAEQAVDWLARQPQLAREVSEARSRGVDLGHDSAGQIVLTLLKLAGEAGALDDGKVQARLAQLAKP